MYHFNENLTSMGLIGFPFADLTLTLKVNISSRDLCWLLSVVSLYLRWPESKSTWLKVEPDLNLTALEELDNKSRPLDESKSIPLFGGDMTV